MAKMLPQSDPVALTSERKSVHGDWMIQSKLAYRLKQTIRDERGLRPHPHNEPGNPFPPHVVEAIDMILVKVSRILSGDYTHADHWHDIAGYARLGKGGHT